MNIKDYLEEVYISFRHDYFVAEIMSASRIKELDTNKGLAVKVVSFADGTYNTWASLSDSIEDSLRMVQEEVDRRFGND